MKKVLLIIDMLNDFCAPEGVLAKGFDGDLYAEPIVPFVVQKFKLALEEHWDIAFICDSHEEDDEEFRRFPKHCVRGAWGAELIEALESIRKKREHDYIFEPGGHQEFVLKNRYSGFFETQLGRLVRGAGEVHVVGVCTNICVLYTVEELCNRDLKAIVYRDGVASFDPEAHRWALKQMETVLGAEIR